MRHGECTSKLHTLHEGAYKMYYLHFQLPVLETSIYIYSWQC